MLLLNKSKLGMAVVNEENVIISVFTDSDFRRIKSTNQQPQPALLVSDISELGNENYLAIKSESKMQKIIEILEINKIWECPSLSKGKIVGLFHTISMFKLIECHAVS